MHSARTPSLPANGVSIADAVRLALPSGTRVLRGHRELRRPVSWARALITRPWDISNLEPGALVMLSLRGTWSHAEIRALPRLIDAFIGSNVSAVAFADESSELLDALGPEADLPILVLPPETQLLDAERAVIGLIVDRVGRVERRAVEIYQHLMQLALDDAATQIMTDALAKAASRVVYLENEYGILQAVATPPDSEILGLPGGTEAATVYSSQDVLGISVGAPATALPPGKLIRRVLADMDWAVCSTPINLGGTIAGFLTLLGKDEDIQDLDEQIVLRAAPAFAVPIAKHRAIMETQTRLQGSFLESLLAGTFLDEEEIMARARYLGHDLRRAYDTACLALDGHAESTSANTEAHRAGLWTSFLDLAHREISETWPRALLRERGDVLALLLPADDASNSADVHRALEEARRKLAGLVGRVTSTVGVGRRAAGAASIVRSYVEAEQAARIGRQFLGGDRTISFKDLGVYRVIARADREALETFSHEFLAALNEYDEQHSGELLETLEGFFACNGNHARAAERLHLHRNTLLYRLGRIEALTGFDLSDPEVRLSMQLALKIRRVMPSLQASQPRNLGGPHS